MNPAIYEINGVGDKVVDTLLLYAFSDFAERADNRVDLQWNFEKGVILRIQSTNPNLQETMFTLLKQSSKGYTLANRLKFRLNIGGTRWSVDPSACIYCYGKRGKKACDWHGNCGNVVVPAYAVFYGNLAELKSLDLQNGGTISKKKMPEYKTLYMGLSPYWSKGIRKWDTQWEGGPSTYISNQLQNLLLHGLAYYAATLSGKKTFIQLIFSPSSGATLGREKAVLCLHLIRRINNSFNLGITKVRLNNLPMKTIPLVLLSQLDLASLEALFDFHLSLFFLAYDKDRGVPKNARGYEEWSLSDISRFYLDLGTEFWDFKSLIADLASNLWRDTYRSRIQGILLDISSAIAGKNVWLLNDAMLKVKLFSREVRLHLPNQNTLIKAQQALT